jgi:hypothetical protein
LPASSDLLLLLLLLLCTMKVIKCLDYDQTV